MAIAKILVPLVGGNQDTSVLAAGVEAARPFNAHVLGLFIRPDPAEALPYLGEGVAGGVVEDVVRVYSEVSDKASERAREAVRNVCEAGKIAQVDRPILTGAVSVSYREVKGDFVNRLADEARLSDLIVFAPLAQNDRLGLTEAFEQVLLETDRPVLLSSEKPPVAFGRRIVIGWDGGTAAAQAVSAACPYLAKADYVEILCIQRPPLVPEMTETVKEYLTLQGVRTNERVVDPGSKRIGETLLAAATEAKADLLVMGGYGHGRLRESLFGGVTRYVVSCAAVPVFVVH